jgi:hypothetical protein
MSGLNVVNNTGTNFTLFYNVLEYFKTIMENHPSIASATQGDIFEIDDKEFQKYPLGNILITNASFVDSTTVYRCQLTVADKIKLKNNNSEGVYNKQTISYLGIDDTVDIHANTLAIINDLLSYTQYAVTNFDIDGEIDCAAFKDRFDNGLGGWVATFDLTTHNDRPRCLFNLLDVTTTTTTTTIAPITTTTTTLTPTTTTTSTSTSTTSTSTTSTSTTTIPPTTTTTSTSTTTSTTTVPPTTTTTSTSTTTSTTTLPPTTTTTTTSAIDPNAAAFLNIAGISDPTISTAVNNLVVGMKSQGIWDRMYAIYPFVGGTRNSSKWNLKDTATFELNQIGTTWTYDSNGVKSNPESSISKNALDTGFIPNASNLNDLSLGVYSRTDGEDGYDMAAIAATASSRQIALIVKYNSTDAFYAGIPTQFTTAVGGLTGLGFFQASRAANNSVVGWINEAQVITNTLDLPPDWLETYRSLQIGNINQPFNGVPSDREYAFAYIGRGLTGAQLSNYNTLVTQFQNALGRAVTPPTTTTTTLAPGTLSVGDAYQGGIVAYVEGTFPNQSGFIAAPSDLANAQWGCQGTFINGTSSAIGTGASNTTLIVNGCGTAGIAARLCSDLVLSGFPDWYLPSAEELRTMYYNRTLIGGFGAKNYWSSTNVPNTLTPPDQTVESRQNAFAINFPVSPFNVSLTKGTSAGVRPIRSFGP